MLEDVHYRSVADTLRKYYEGESLSDQELEEAIKVISPVVRFLLFQDRVFFLAWKQLNAVVIEFEQFLENRNFHRERGKN